MTRTNVSLRRRHQKAYQLRQLTGEKAFVDARPVRARLLQLRGAGWSMRAIAGAANTSPSVVSRILHGRQTQMRPEVARRLMQVRGLPHAPSKQTTQTFVPRRGTLRRLQALMWMGWGHQQMREHSGLNTAALLHQQGRWVTRTTHDKVAAMFHDLCMRPGPSSKARTYARARGYAPPLAWDDPDHDPAAAA